MKRLVHNVESGDLCGDATTPVRRRRVAAEARVASVQRAARSERIDEAQHLARGLDEAGEVLTLSAGASILFMTAVLLD